jgi:threonyl-tRNA synthetase
MSFPTHREKMRHSLAHLLAAAVLEKFPTAKLGIGPAVADGFYYDIQFSRPITEELLRSFEQRMRELIRDDLPFSQTRWTKAKAHRFFKKQPFKRELIKALPGKTVGISRCGNFTDLCRGGHVERTSAIKAFTLTHTAGAYWRGDEKRPQLTRIYGLAFESEPELNEHRARVEEARKRDHKILGPKLGFFFFHETAPGMPYWLSKGMVVLNELIRFWREEHGRYGYQEIATPLVNKKELWETSGHWEYYKDAMFLADMGKNEVYGVKPMNCPNAMVVFGSAIRSYKDLPLRLSDIDVIHRYERSGTLNGLLRLRAFRQDDSHNFITEDQIGEEYRHIFDLAKRFYGVFGLPYHFRLGTRPKKFLGDRKTWDRAEAALKSILDEKVGREKYAVFEGDGAFYGPKIDILMNDALGREWQMGTWQLDFQQPRRFKLSYIDKDGKKKTPVVVHRVIYGSLDRFVGILMEQFAGAFPLWLAPIQIRVLTVTQEVAPYTASVVEEFRRAGVRVDVDDSPETLPKKIRTAELEKIPLMVVLGKKEVAAHTVALRAHGGQDLGTKSRTDTVAFVRSHIDRKSLSLQGAHLQRESGGG